MAQTMFKIDEGTNLQLSPALRRLEGHLRDLIIIACERSLKVPSKSLCLTRLQYVYDENSVEKSCMHFVAQVRELSHDDAITLRLSFIVETE